MVWGWGDDLAIHIAERSLTFTSDNQLRINNSSCFLSAFFSRNATKLGTTVPQLVSKPASGRDAAKTGEVKSSGLLGPFVQIFFF